MRAHLRIVLVIVLTLAAPALLADDNTAGNDKQASSSANSGLLMQVGDGRLLFATGADIGHEVGILGKAAPILLGLGYAYGPQNYESAALCLYRSAGANTLDPSFGRNGATLTPLPPAKNRDFVTPTTLVPDRTGGAYVIGSRSKWYGLDGNVTVATVAHYDARGALDASFADHGTLTERIDDAGITIASAAALDDRGRLLVAGYNGGRRTTSRLGSFDDYSVRIVLMRYMPSGRLDPSFGNGGIAVQTIEADDKRNSRSLREFLRDYYKSVGLLLEADGRATVAAANAEGDTTYLMRFDKMGKLDPAFGQGGITRNSADAIVSVLQRDRKGRLLAFGSGNHGIAMQRYANDGTPDTAYDDKGAREVPLALGSIRVPAVLSVKNGGFLAAASGDFQQVILAKIDAEAVPDETFGSGGIIKTPLAVSGIIASGLSLDKNDDPVISVFSGSGARHAGAGLVHYSGGISKHARYESTDFWATCSAHTQ